MIRRCLFALFTCLVAAGTAVADWPTLHGDATRSGFYPSFPKGPLKLVWRKELHTELTAPRAEVIVAGGLAFMGTYAGNLYAWDARTGDQRWLVKTNGPIGHSPMFSGGVLYTGSMDRHLYAIDAATGRIQWTFEASEGIWTSPLIANGLAMFGARDGVFYAVNITTGQLAWKHQTAAPVLTSASLSEDGSRVLFASEDMHAYCLDAKTGTQLWKSRKLSGLSLRDHFPVIHKGLAFFTTNPVRDFHNVLDTDQQMLLRWANSDAKDQRYIPAAKEDIDREQDRIINHLKQNPHDQTFYVLNVSDGKEPWLAPILYTAGLHNPSTPPCVNRKTGGVFLLLRSAYGAWDGGGEVRPFTALGQLNLSTGRVELIDHAHKPKEAGRPAGRKDMPWNTFHTIGDETQTLSCSEHFLFSNHQGALGALNFRTRLTENLWGKRDSYAGFYGPAAFGWPQNGGREKAAAAREPYGLVNEWHGPAKAIVSVSGKYVYYPSGSQAICLEGSE